MTTIRSLLPAFALLTLAAACGNSTGVGAFCDDTHPCIAGTQCNTEKMSCEPSSNGVLPGDKKADGAACSSDAECNTAYCGARNGVRVCETKPGTPGNPDGGGNNANPNGPMVNMTIEWTAPDDLDLSKVTRVVFIGSIPGWNGSQWHDLASTGLNTGEPEKVISVSGRVYTATRKVPADMARKLTIQARIEVGNMSASLPSRTNQQHACYRLWGDDANRAGCTGTGCFRSYGQMRIITDRINQVWSVPGGQAVGNGLGADKIDGCNYYGSY
jgi:hypothetical protein